MPTPIYDIKTRGRPGMLAPTYQELQVDRNETVDTSLTRSRHKRRARAAEAGPDGRRDEPMAKPPSSGVISP